MRKLIKYRLSNNLHRDTDFNNKPDKELKKEAQTAELQNFEVTKTGDSWVPATCEVDDKRSYVVLSKESRRPGFSAPKENKAGAALLAKKFGNTYRVGDSTHSSNLNLKNIIVS